MTLDLADIHQILVENYGLSDSWVDEVLRDVRKHATATVALGPNWCLNKWINGDRLFRSQAGALATGPSLGESLVAEGWWDPEKKRVVGELADALVERNRVHV